MKWKKKKREAFTMVKLFNGWYFFFILLSAGAFAGLYFALRNKSEKTKKIVLASILFFNLALHFLKLTFPPYSTNRELALREVWFVNVCGTSVLFFPFLFISKSLTAKNYMFFLGAISGFLALLYPTEALDKSVLTLDVWRFYLCHFIIIAVPVLAVKLKLFEVNVKTVLKIPVCVTAMLLFIICNQVLQSELGAIPLRDGNMLEVNWRNPSLIWGPTDDVAVLFSWLTPEFMKTIPFGSFAGQGKYWPLFWMLPGVLVYFTVIPLALCFLFNRKNTVLAFKTLFHSVKSRFVKPDPKPAIEE
ncbi:MAG: YwaF family protein [Clostridia bacterium]|nr:YwaF family protein [Clostridia bacterium]